MTKELCTIYDCEWDLYYKGAIEDNTVYRIDEEGSLAPAGEYICEHIDFDMVQFYTGCYDGTYTEPGKGTSKWGYFQRSTGRVIVPPTYDYAYPFYCDRAKVQKNKKYGFIDPEGSAVVEIIWDDTANAFHKALCWVKEGDKFGYIDKYGTVVLPPQFEVAKGFQFIGKSYDEHKYAALVKKDGKYGYIDEKGNYIFEPGFKDARKFWRIGHEPVKSFAPIRIYEKWGFIDINGDFAAAFQFDDVGQEGAFSTTGNINKEKALFGAEHIHFYTVRKFGQWGLMNSDFNVIMPEDGKRYVEYRGTKVYIKDGKVTSMRKLEVKKD